MKHTKVFITSLFVVSMFALAGCGQLADCFCDNSCKPKCDPCCPKPVCKPCVENKRDKKDDKCCVKKRCCPPQPCQSKCMPNNGR